MIIFIGLYILLTLAVGIFTARYVKTVKDFALASKKMPVFITASALFATWFGSETIMGATSEFLQHGMQGVIEDPFGAALCLFLLGLFFAKVLYNMNLLTMGDFFRNKYGRKVELVSSLLMICSYFGWIAAQLVAFAIILNIVTGISVNAGVLIAAVVVLAYTYAGGMWAISITDFIQTIMIIVGLLIIAVDMVWAAGGLGNVINAYPPQFWNALPEPNPQGVLDYVACLMVIGLGSIPQQDVFQRLTSAETDKAAVRASLIGGAMYLSVAMLPLLIVAAAKVLYPEITSLDGQTVLLAAISKNGNLFIQILFFGALLSAIMSTASGAILAPATTLAENIVKPMLHKVLNDQMLLHLMRSCVVVVTIIGLAIANSNKNIYELVGNSSMFSLVSLFIPLVAGLWWKRANTQGCMLSMLGGLITWYSVDAWPLVIAGLNIPSIIAALVVGTILMVVGSLVTRKS